MHSTLGNFVFVYPYVVSTNDPTPPSNVCIGTTVGDFSQIATGSILLSGVKIGHHCLVGACSSVTKDVPDYQLVVYIPAKVLNDVREIKGRETGEAHYPWHYRFSRNVPWGEIGFDDWYKLLVDSKLISVNSVGRFSVGCLESRGFSVVFAISASRISARGRRAV